MDMTCAKCGNENREGAKFCKKCGSAVPVAGTTTTTTGSGLEACSACNARNTAGSRFCATCGNPMGATPPLTTSAPAPTMAPPLPSKLLPVPPGKRMSTAPPLPSGPTPVLPGQRTTTVPASVMNTASRYTETNVPPQVTTPAAAIHTYAPPPPPVPAPEPFPVPVIEKPVALPVTQNVEAHALVKELAPDPRETLAAVADSPVLASTSTRAESKASAPVEPPINSSSTLITGGRAVAAALCVLVLCVLAGGYFWYQGKQRDKSAAIERIKLEAETQLRAERKKTEEANQAKTEAELKVAKQATANGIARSKTEKDKLAAGGSSGAVVKQPVPARIVAQPILVQPSAPPVAAQPAPQLVNVPPPVVQAPVPQAPASPKEFCEGKPNFVSKGLCDQRECEKPQFVDSNYCKAYRDMQARNRRIEN